MARGARAQELAAHVFLSFVFLSPVNISCHHHGVKNKRHGFHAANNQFGLNLKKRRDEKGSLKLELGIKGEIDPAADDDASTSGELARISYCWCSLNLGHDLIWCLWILEMLVVSCKAEELLFLFHLFFS